MDDLSLAERATSSSLPSEDWALNMEICDVINGSEEGWVSLAAPGHQNPPFSDPVL